MSSNNNKRRNRQKKQASFIASVFRFLVIVLIPVYVIMLIYDIRKNNTPSTDPAENVSDISVKEDVSDQSEKTDHDENTSDTSSDSLASFENLSEDDIYTFLQGPVAWNTKSPWSGEWCEEILGGQRFSVFGCGLCALANIYSTLTPFECSPVDMFYYARETTGYSPSGNYGAIAWEYMQEALETTGIYGRLHKKDKTYEEFQKNIQNGITAIVLISSANDNTYWKNHSGHYVNIWLYDSSDDSVFLADSGNPDHNRQRIPLKYVYNALNTSDTWQYLLIDTVDTGANSWQHDGIDRDWTPPDNY